MNNLHLLGLLVRELHKNWDLGVEAALTLAMEEQGERRRPVARMQDAMLLRFVKDADAYINKDGADEPVWLMLRWKDQVNFLASALMGDWHEFEAHVRKHESLNVTFFFQALREHLEMRETGIPEILARSLELLNEQYNNAHPSEGLLAERRIEGALPTLTEGAPYRLDYSRAYSDIFGEPQQRWLYDLWILLLGSEEEVAAHVSGVEERYLRERNIPDELTIELPEAFFNGEGNGVPGADVSA